MRVKRVIKFYFVLMMTIVTGAGLSYSDGVKDFYASSLHTLDIAIDEIQSSELVTTDRLFPTVEEKIAKIDEASKENVLSSFQSRNSNSGIFNFDIVKNGDSYFASPGNKNISVMSFSMKTGDDPMELEHLKLKVVGTDAENIGNVTLIERYGDDIIPIAFAKRVDQSFVFERVNYSVNPFEQRFLTLQVDFGSGVNSGQRIRFDIEGDDDLRLEVGKKKYRVSDFYPMKGKYVSIVNVRK